MCQGLPLGCFRLLVGLCGVGQKFWLLCAILHILLEHQTVLKPFALSSYIKRLFFPNFSEFLEYQKYGRCSDYYRLSCLRQILFLMHCFACFDETIDSISGLSHEKVILQYTQCKNKI